ncbi:MAG: ParB/RepB/Spo0J family partition protein [Planctomycetota bacterium]
MSGSKKLGRGLDTLIPRSVPTPIPVESLPPVPGTEGKSSGEVEATEAAEQSTDSTIAWIDPKSIQANRDQPRERFDDEAIDELAHSIRENGILQPLVVRQSATGTYELVAGERRLRASQRLELPQVPAIVKVVTDDQLLELALIENIQRENLNPIELAKAYSALRDQHGWTQEQLADRLGKKRPSVANTLRLLELPSQVQKSLELAMLSVGHAKVLLTLPADEQLQMHERVVNEGLSVRALEAALREPQDAETAPELEERDPTPASSGSSLKVKPPHVAEQEDLLSRALGTKVEIREGRGRGRIVIDYYSTDDYERLTQRMMGHS